MDEAVKPVGYGSPPNHSKWQKGQSGNPQGRRKGSVNLKTDLMQELNETIAITENGKPRRISKQRALIKSLMNNSIKGDPRAVGALIRMILTLSDDSDASPAGKPSPQDEQILRDYVARQVAKPEDTP